MFQPYTPSVMTKAVVIVKESFNLAIVQCEDGRRLSVLTAANVSKNRRGYLFQPSTGEPYFVPSADSTQIAAPP